MQTSLIISSGDPQEPISKSITNINPEATDSNLYQLGTLFNAISNNTLQSVVRVDRKELTSTSGGNE